ncbi:dTDP-4-dehydrorhamnose reductase [Loktanella atrilutea]|uniref:dTDP-4-dehydrorhamnose reductase n=1 Tax=Loktanella atrilutea TaxID=366533 RepID=A0A1M5EKB3_LOKAT|nr:NAD(P)-dependent oxidoreductase [Loktanella atrilutea]SHF79753.1 dTDP-4-dehydrorhamnose reductase [Loktanella atrilutea]
MTKFTQTGPLILGASGRVGRALARAWPAGAPAPLRQSRDGAGGMLAWDILNAPAPDLPPIDSVVVLAGIARGTDKALTLNTSLAQTGADLGERLGVPVLVASSQAVYGSQPGLLREDQTLKPTSAYGRAKAAMEAAVTGPHVTHLRIGNVAGCDALAAGIAQGGVVLDRFADGQGPRRAYCTPHDLARVLIGLAAAPARPPVVNIARPGIVAMADVLDAAGVAFNWTPAPAEALPEMALDVTLLQGICPLPPADAAAVAGALA